MSEQETYLNCILIGRNDYKPGRDGLGYFVAVYPEKRTADTDLLFYESTFMSGTYISIQYGERNSEQAYEELEKITFSKARARIVLEIFDQGKNYEQNIGTNSGEHVNSILTDEEIQKRILQVLYNIRKKNPLTYKSIKIDIDGFCYLLKIDKQKYHFNAGLLLEEGYIDQGDVEELCIENGGINITSDGIKVLSQMNDETTEKNHHKTRVEEHNNKKMKNRYNYDVAISFAGSERDIAEKLAKIIRDADFIVFYDKFYEVDLWGKDLAIKFDKVFRIESRYCVVFISDEYSKRMWPRHEIRSALSRALKERDEDYILPIRVDDTDIPGLQPTTGYLSLDDYTIEKISEILISKIQGNFHDRSFKIQSEDIYWKEDVKTVNNEYLKTKKIIEQAEIKNITFRWCDPDRIEELKLKGYEVYYETDVEKHIKYLLENKDNQILIFKKSKY